MKDVNLGCFARVNAILDMVRGYVLVKSFFMSGDLILNAEFNITFRIQCMVSDF